MDKVKKIEFKYSRDPIPGKRGSGFQFLVADGGLLRSLRTKAEESWPMEAFIDTEDDKENLHFISYDESTESYLLESSIRIGKGYQRQDSKMTVEEIKAASGGESPESMEKIVELLAASLAYNSEGFFPRPTFELERSNPPLEPDDPLYGVRGAAGLSLEKRKVIRALISQDPVEKEGLPKGMLTFI
jgi:hypothetical protein